MNYVKVLVPYDAKRLTNYDNFNMEFKDEQDRIEITDGYHTMSELYEHRHALFVALLKIYDNYITPLNTRVKCWKSLVHNDMTMFPGWFIAGMNIKQFDGTEKQITYHLPIKWFDRINVMVLPVAPEWDGHDSNDVIRRLGEL